MLDTKRLSQIAQDIIKKFPEFKGVIPKIVQKIIPVQSQAQIRKKLAIGMLMQRKRITSLRFTKAIKTADAAKIERYLVVTIDEKGEIIKITHSK
ncbi:MAG TPA: hypothetical protein VF399_07470 [bacterium]